VTPRLILSAGAAAAVAALLMGALAAPVLRGVDLRLYDATFRWSRIQDPVEGVALVLVDDASIAIKGQWPWPRDELARLVDTLVARGAEVVALDLLLSEPDRGAATDPSNPDALSPADAVLARSVGSAPVVLGHAFTFNGPSRPEGSGCVLHPLPLVQIQRSARSDPLQHLFRAAGAVCSLPGLSKAAASSGFLNASSDRDGVMRRAPVLVAWGDQVLPALSLAAVLQVRPVAGVGLEATPSRDLRLALDGLSVPLDKHGTMLVRYRGGSGTFPQFSASDVLLGLLPEDAVRDQVVFVGVSALGLRDAVTSPFDHRSSGVEVHASMAASLLDGRFIQTPAWTHTLVVLATLLAGPGAAVLVLWSGLAAGSLLALGLTAAVWLGVLRRSLAMGVFASPVMPTVAVGLSLLSLVALRVRYERRRAGAEQRRREETYRFAVQSLTSLMEARDQDTGQHARRTSAYVGLLAGRLRSSSRFRDYLTRDRIAMIAQLAPLHDIGKVGVPDAVLLKPGPLTSGEAAEMRKHPEYGYEAIVRAERDAGLSSDSDGELLQVAKELVRNHHERWDGGGYPRGLAGEDIPIPGRIMAVVDVYDAMVQPRVYQDAATHPEIVALISGGRGTAFDPDVVDAFLEVEDDFRQLAGKLAGRPLRGFGGVSSR
jgi:HD-GYP domain-containing protein (c-di-GMP phosphodiesterase class II)